MASSKSTVNSVHEVRGFLQDRNGRQKKTHRAFASVRPIINLKMKPGRCVVRASTLR